MNRYFAFLIVLFVLVLTSCSSMSVAGNESEINLPNGYTLENYTVVEKSNIACNYHSDCETPVSYLVRSNCPYRSLCLEDRCAVVCPTSNQIPFTLDANVDALIKLK